MPMPLKPRYSPGHLLTHTSQYFTRSDIHSEYNSIAIMRVLVLICAFSVLIATVLSFPADSQNINPDREVEELPPGSYPMDSPSGFDGFLGGFNDMFERMRQQMLQLLSIVPRIGSGTPEGGNTTSVTKIIGGHKVVVNETVYTSGNGNDTAAVFKVRIVDIQPNGESDESHPNSAEPERSVESVENSGVNEIYNSLGDSKQKRKVNNLELLEDNYDGLESFGDPSDEWSNNDIETFDDIDTGIDLSNDIYINEIAAAQGRPHNADAELFDVPRPHDLSRDTYVNEIAAREHWPHNPHAEFINQYRPEHKRLHNKPEMMAGPFYGQYAPVGSRAEFVSQYGPTRQALNRDSRNPYYYNIENS